MFIQAYKAAFKTIAKKPLMLWGLSILSSIVCIIATLVSGVLGFIGVAFGYVISVGMAKVYLDGIEGKEVNSDQLFSGFSNRVFRIAGGMAWKDLWTIIWTGACLAVPYLVVLVFTIIGMSFGFEAAGVFAIIGLILAALIVLPVAFFLLMKVYSYAFVPHILATKPDVTATQALRLSMELTQGKKLWMWLADIIYGAIVFFITLTLTLLGLIPYIGFLFKLVLLVWTIAIIAFGPLFQGLYTAEFYRLKKAPKAPKAPANPYGGPGGYNPNMYPNNGYAPQPNPNAYAPQPGYAPQPNPNAYAPQPNPNAYAPQPGYAPQPNPNTYAPQPNQNYNPLNR